MKKILIISLMLCTSMAIMAIPAKRKPRTITQPDGSKITVVLRGDENFHFYTNENGAELVKDSKGIYRKASTSEAKAMREKWAKKLKARNNSYVRKARKIKRMVENNGVVGTKKGLVILVNFTDVSMKSANNRAAFNEMFNKEGYDKNYHIGSVRDYFKDQSYGKLTIDFDVVGPYKLSKSLSYYGQNVDNEGEPNDNGSDAHPASMVAEACKLANADVNFKDYDWDGDGIVDQVYVIYAGYSESSSDEPDDIWPHSWWLSEGAKHEDGPGALTLDGVTIDNYACSSELAGESGNRMAGIGSAVHEFSHCMGLPDFYDTGDAGNFGLDSWSVMDYGAYNGPYISDTEDYQGNVPAGYTSYERMYCGWLTPTELSYACKVNGMQPLTQKDEAYIIYNDAFKDEFYMLENRQLDSWDKYGYGHGMLVLHVDYDEDVWFDNEINNKTNHQRCTIIPADNQFATGYNAFYGTYYATEEDLEGDPYPGTSNNTALTDTSTPKATLYNKNTDGQKLMGKPIENIAESTSGLISFKFMGGIYVEAPVANEASAISLSGFTASWNAVEGAKDYTIELISEDKEAPEPVETRILFEDFSKMKNSAESAEVTEENEAQKMSTTGWYFYKVFECMGKIRLGSGKYGSEFATPYLNTTTGAVIVRFKEAVYKTDKTTIGVWILDENDDDVTYQEVEITGTANQMQEHVLLFSDVPETFCVDFYVDEAGHRYYLDDVEVISLEGTVNREVQTFTGITDTKYVFNNLDPTKVYSYRVRANTAEASSVWSNIINVELSATTIPEDVNRDGEVNGLDVLKVYKFMQTSTGSTSGVVEDVNGDGDVNGLDVLKIYKYMQSH